MGHQGPRSLPFGAPGRESGPPSTGLRTQARAAAAGRSRQGMTLDGILAKPQGRQRSDGLLLRADGLSADAL